MNDRMVILEFSLNLEGTLTKIVLNSFFIQKDNINLIKYFGSKGTTEKMIILREFGLVNKELYKKLDLFFRIRNALIHIKSNDNLTKLNEKLINDLSKYAKTMPSDLNLLSEEKKHKVLINVMENNLYGSLNIELKEILNKSKKKFDDSIYTVQRQQGFKIYKSFTSAIHKLFNEMPEYKISKKIVEKMRSRYMDIYLEELELKHPELFNENLNVNGDQS